MDYRELFRKKSLRKTMAAKRALSAQSGLTEEALSLAQDEAPSASEAAAANYMHPLPSDIYLKNTVVEKMADPFEVRMRFTSQLQHLNASVTSAQKAAHYAIKYRDMDEDLHSCILEQLERNSMNNRANIFYFIEQLCDLAQRENHPTFVHMIRRDIYRIVDAVAPSDGSGAANVKVVRKGLPKLQQQSVIDAETLTDLEAALKEREVSMSHPALSPMETDTKADPNRLTTPRPNGLQKLDKRQIEQRIEEDRERHKRLKESIWGVGGDEYEEADKMWEEGSDIGEDDLLAAEEETADKLGITVEELRKSS